eukprot:scaffold53991_cov69-Phaeocystis_antarctica.AAC.4
MAWGTQDRMRERGELGASSGHLDPDARGGGSARRGRARSDRLCVCSARLSVFSVLFGGVLGEKVSVACFLPNNTSLENFWLWLPRFFLLPKQAYHKRASALRCIPVPRPVPGCP